MKLASLLSEHRVLPEMIAETHREALAEMIDHLLEAGALGVESRDTILDALYAREERVSTGIGHGVAIPHCYCSELEKPVALLVIMPRSILSSCLSCPRINRMLICGPSP
jgi:PTS system nitrogen regulatory IIA component